MTPIIEVKNLSKQYRIGQRQRYLSLRDALVDTFKFRQNNAINHSQTIETDFWALNDISFDVQAGESIGIIGRNGAGKSTLLKILSRITPPTKGKAILRGRMASLLEVGTGFHQELTGRENIFLNGAILGMTRKEIRTKFDEIVAFAEVERFLDTPVKRYSSGMYVRLAFAVAAHLDPEILIVDEVLAVGDTMFQAKCLGKLDDVARGGRTVIFVSHDLAAMQRLCSTGVHMAEGSVRNKGTISHIVAEYLQVRDRNGTVERSHLLAPGFRLATVNVQPTPVTTGQPLSLEFRFTIDGEVEVEELIPFFVNDREQRVAILDLWTQNWKPRRLETGSWSIEARLNSVPFVEGRYSIGLFFRNRSTTKDLKDIGSFFVIHPSSNDSGRNIHPRNRGCVELGFEWKETRTNLPLNDD